MIPDGDRTLSRRSVLGHMAALAGIGALGFGGCSPLDTGPLSTALVELCPDPSGATAIGRSFLAESPETSGQHLARRLAVELDWQPELDRETLTERLLTRIRTDFRDGKTLRVDGWILSQTEVWWAAVVALA